MIILTISHVTYTGCLYPGESNPSSRWAASIGSPEHCLRGMIVFDSHDKTKIRDTSLLKNPLFPDSSLASLGIKDIHTDGRPVGERHVMVDRQTTQLAPSN